MTISLCMIVKNEELVLRRCLASVKDLVDEIIIVDTGSTDKTKEIAKDFTDKIYDFEWVDDFAKARNFAFSKGTGDYLMWLDADDVIENEDREKFLNFKKNELVDDSISIYRMRYVWSFDSRGNVLGEIKRGRLFRRKDNPTWQGRIHEVIPFNNNQKILDIKIYHKKVVINDPDRDLRIYKKMIQDGVKLDARDSLMYGRCLSKKENFVEAAKQYESFLNEYKDTALKNNVYQAVCRLAEAYKKTGRLEESYKILDEYIKSGKETHSRIWYEMGDYFLKKKQYYTAIKMFEEACAKNRFNLDFDETGLYEIYYPNISIGICYYYLKNKEKALEYNEIAAKANTRKDIIDKNREIYLKM